VVKGASEANLQASWVALRFSSQDIHDRITASGPYTGQPKLKIARVVDVGGTDPRIWLVEEGADFKLVPEIRWIAY
jgi:hypothetical protein